MALISFVGKVDKRILVLPLIRALSIEGKTAVYTDDSNLRNLFSSKTKQGTIEDIDIIFCCEPNSGLEQEIIDSEARHVVMIFTDYSSVKADVIINCSNIDRSFKKDEDELEEEVPDNQINVIFSSRPIRKVPNVLVLKPDYYRYLVETEETKELQIIKDKEINLFLAKIMDGKVDMTKEQFLKLLSRKRIQYTAKSK